MVPVMSPTEKRKKVCSVVPTSSESDSNVVTSAIPGVTLTARASGHPVTLLSRLTLPELASLLATSPAALAAQLEVTSGDSGLRLCLAGLLGEQRISKNNDVGIDLTDLSFGGVALA